MAGKLNRYYKIIPNHPAKILGTGIEGFVEEVTLKSPWIKKRSAAKKSRYTFRPCDYTHLKKQVAQTRRTWRVFKKAGLLVPEFYIPIFRKKSKYYLSVLMENLEKKYGKLIAVNDSLGKPYFLKQLKMETDRKLISELGEDLATIVSLGFQPYCFDFWQFYKKPDGSYGRVIADLSLIGETVNHKNLEYKQFIETRFYRHIREELLPFFGQREKVEFLKAYTRKLNELL